MRYRDRSKRTPYVRPVTKIELSEKNIKLRTILIVLFLSIGAVALGFALASALKTEPGWKTAETSSSSPNCSQEFTMNYYFGISGANATAENRQVNQLYTAATENAYRIFSPDVLEEGLLNVGYVNAHVNEEIAVDATLYKAFEQISKYQNRCIFLAPVYVEYDRIFFAQSDAEAAQFDPNRESEILAYVSELASYASDPSMIDLQLLGDNRIRLCVSDSYLAYAQEHEISEFIDFGWMKNAFIADYIADLLADHGFTNGYLVSYDGFTRNLDARGENYGLNLFDRVDTTINLPAVMHYNQPMSVVFLRDYPMSATDSWHYYGYDNGDIVTTYIDVADGLDKCAMSNLVSYSSQAGCAEILLQMIPVFIADEFDSGLLNDMTESNIFSVWFENQILRYNESDLMLVMNPDASGYSSAFSGR